MFKIRGHTLLCLQGFRGEGYSNEFVSNMDRIHSTLFNDPQAEVEVVVGPDDICAACPHLKDNLCTLNGPGTERDMIRKDNSVIALLGISTQGKYKWFEILNRVSERLNPFMLKDLCCECQWYHLGYCEEGVTVIKERACQR